MRPDRSGSSGEGRSARAKQRVINAAEVGLAQMPGLPTNRARRQRKWSNVRRDQRAGEVYRRTDKAIVVAEMVRVVGPGRLLGVGLYRSRRNTRDTCEITQMDVAERERRLQRQREQRQRSRKSAVRSIPTHDRGRDDEQQTKC